MSETYDVVVVGGGAAGLSGAMALGRARRTVLVVDSGSPRNAPAGHVHNFLSREGTPPGELLAAGRAEVGAYGGEIVSGTVIAVDREHDGFRVELDDGRSVRARRLLVTTGLVDELPDVDGLAQRWGRDVLHCPYCHGWEVRDRPIGVLATGPLAVHQALMWRQLSTDVTLFRHTAPAFAEAEHEQLAARGIAVVDGEVAGLEIVDDRLTGVRLRTGAVVAREAVVVAPRCTARAGVLAALGLVAVDQEMGGHVVGSAVPADPTGLTAVPGVWVAGNVADLRAQVIVAAAAGLNAAAAINADLIDDDVRHAVGVARMFTEQAWEERYGEHEGVWSGRPNPQLVAEASDLPAGAALDVGCGEGADALWLASRGWRVTAVDFSTTALKRAQAAGGDGVEWRHADLTVDPLEEGAYDLVSAQYMHLPPTPRRELYARLAAAVAPGGRLLIVGHHPSDLYSGAHRPPMPEMFFTAEELAADLTGEWDVLAVDARPRDATGPEGGEITVRDAVLHARRERLRS